MAANQPAILGSLKHELLISETFVTQCELHTMVARFVPESLPT